MKYDSFRHTVKYAITPCTPEITTFFFIKYKNEWKELKLRRHNNQKSNFYKNKKVIKIDDIDVKPYGTKNLFKYFIGCNDNDVIRPLCIKFPQMIGYVRKFEVNTTMSFKIIDSKLLKKYNQI